MAVYFNGLDHRQASMDFRRSGAIGLQQLQAFGRVLTRWEQPRFN